LTRQQNEWEQTAMKNVLTVALALMISLYCFKVSLAQDQDKPKVLWTDPVRYQIVILKFGPTDWAASFNEVILLDRQEGRTWTLKSKNLKEGWVTMPLEDAEKKR
jgi:hypothetical protein